MTGVPAGAVAIIGMSGRFPGAGSVAELWENLRAGRESISRFTAADLEAEGLDPRALAHPGFVNAGGVLDGVDLFDAGFFGFSAREAEITDPQQRLFLECVEEALEDAGCDPLRYEGAIGLFAGAAMSRYFFNLLARPDLTASIGHVQLLLGNDKDHLTTRTAYKLNLRGPAITVQTTCSTSLVAVCLACRQLLDHECDMAVAGGVSISLPQKSGYLYQPGGINSPDGRCRAFDARAQGTVGGNGVAVVVLKRFEDALLDRDPIYAIVRGAAMNNDGGAKIGYTAPSIEGQAAVIATAQAIAGVDPETITYVETHGTGTPLGDPIEIAALTQVFRASTERSGYCGIGSIKTNVGHLDCAAGAAGLIKATLALAHRELPPSLHFETPNPKLDLDRSPFYVNTTLREWTSDGPRRAGVSSFGIGGTNAHVVLEEAPPRPASGASRPFVLLPISARSPGALEQTSHNLAEYLARHPDVNLADVAFTQATGRRLCAHRRAMVARTAADAARALSGASAGSSAASRDRRLVFAFPGQGAQHAGMARDLYASERTFREDVDRCAAALVAALDGVDLRDVLYGEPDPAHGAWFHLDDTALAQPALFTIEYSLARLLMRWGLRPDGMLGHSIGEYVAACLADVVSLEDALSLVAARGRFMQQMPRGAMLAVEMPEAGLRALAEGRLDIAAVNGPSRAVVSGTFGDIEWLEGRLAECGIACRRLRTSHAFHSRMMTDAAAAIEQAWGGVSRRRPSRRFMSNVTGDWIDPAAAADPPYWARQLRETVRFDTAIARLLDDPGCALLEVGPGTTLTTLVADVASGAGARPCFAAMRHPRDRRSDVAALLDAVGRLWEVGFDVDWNAFYADERRARLHLPTYPFERSRYWIDPPRPVSAASTSNAAAARDVSTFLYRPAWRASPLANEAAPTPGAPGVCLVFGGRDALTDAVVTAAERRGRRVIRVFQGDAFESTEDGRCVVRAESREDYDSLVRTLDGGGQGVDEIVHLWTASTGADGPSREAGATDAGAELASGFFSLLGLAQALARHQSGRPVRLLVVSRGLHAIDPSDRPVPARAAVLGPVRVVPQEMPHVWARSVDLGGERDEDPQDVAIRVIDELSSGDHERIVAHRGAARLVPTVERLRVDPPLELPIRSGGVYVITGGFGGIGRALARHLAREYRARLVLVGRSPVPPREEWETVIASRSDDRAVRAVATIRELESAGATVMAEAADVGDAERLSEVFSRVRARSGRIDGVIHCAGVPGGGMLQRRTSEQARTVLRPKIEGTLAIAAALAPDRPDFIVLCSSLAASLGGFGQVDYCAANAFLDAWAQSSTFSPRALSIEWDTWREAGMAVETNVPGELEAARQENLRRGLTDDEGIAAFRLALASGQAQVLVSTHDLAARIAACEPGRMSAPAAARAPAAQPLPAGPAPAHARPDLDVPYEAPRTPIEILVAAVWEELLGVAPVGIRDDFFALGGHSLLAIQVTSRLRQALDVDVPVQVLFDAATVEGLARDVEERLASTPAGRQRLDELAAYVESLSDAEVEQLLEKERLEDRA